MKSKKKSATKSVNKSKANVKDLKPRKNPKGGIGMLLPAVQKARSTNASQSFRS